MNVSLSSAHSKRAAPLKLNVAVVASVSAAGSPAEESVVCGAASIVQVKLAGLASGCSAASSARTRSVCAPAASDS